MPETSTMTVELTPQNREFLRRMVENGAYPSESEVVSAALELRREIAEEQERWEREVLIPVHDELMANPSSAIPLEQVERSLALDPQEHRKAG